MKTLKIFNNYFINPTFLSFSLITLAFLTSYYIDNFKEDTNLTFILILTIFLTNIFTKISGHQFKSVQLKQIIREEGPKNHQKKAGTPTMGGIIVIPSGLLIGDIITINQGINKELIAINILVIGFMLIGFLDDWRSYSLKKNTGLTPKGKILLLLFISIIFLIFCFYHELIDSKISIFSDISIQLNHLIWPLALFILLAESNATNLTDGLDGLASGCGAIVLTGLAIELIIRGNPGDLLMAKFCIAMSGAWLGFLLNNKHPAKIFMGDAGSLAMGGFLAGIGLISNTLWGLLIMGIVFLAESLSVIVQVLFFKISKKINGSGKRIFKMAPLHHHYELSGQKEVVIVRNFWLLSISFVIGRLLFL